jgi:hypothetical protein
MPKDSGVAPTNRRVFVQMGAGALVMAVAGCSEGEVKQVTEPPVAKGGNRARLNAMQKNAADAAVKKKEQEKE